MSKEINKNIVTKEGYEKFKAELEYLKSVGRVEAAEKIRTASEFGDLSENSEYDAAKDAQALLEQRIFKLEDFLKNVEIVEVQNDDNVTVGKKISLTKKDDNSKYDIMLVGNNEASPFDMQISVASPIGKAILGKKVGETFEVDAPSGRVQYVIENVQLN